MLPGVLRYYMHGSSLVKQFACMHWPHRHYKTLYTNDYQKRLAMQSWERAILTLSVRSPPISNCFVYIKMLTTERIKHFFNLSIYRTVFAKIVDQIIYTISQMNEYANK